MKKVLGELLDEQDVPNGVKERLMKAAKTQLLLKDLGSLFGSNAPKSAAQVIEVILPHQKNIKP